MRWIGWLLVGFALVLLILIALVLIGFARLSPSLARRLAASSLAAGLLGILVELGIQSFRGGDERLR